MKIGKGTEVLIKAVILCRLCDERPEDKRGYEVKTSRGKVYVEPQDIYIPLVETK